MEPRSTSSRTWYRDSEGAYSARPKAYGSPGFRVSLAPRVRARGHTRVRRAVVLWPLGAVVRRLRKRHLETEPTWRRALWVSWVVSAMNLVFLLAVLLTFGEELVFGVPLSIRVLLVIPIITSILAVVLLILTAIAWVRRYGSLWGRLTYSFISLASVLFVLFAGYWNMLGWRF